MAVLDDKGTIIVVGRQTGATTKEIKSAFKRGNKAVVDFMGGALIIENGKAMDSHDLGSNQGFDHGFAAGQFHKAQHTLVGVNDGQPYLILSPPRRCVPLPNNSKIPNVQSDLLDAGFASVVKFDGGSGFYAHSSPDYGGLNIRGRDSLGLCIHVRK